ncbi:MAG: hypothetical protein ACLRZH_07410 [Ruthenibacterium lactatiformans]
MYGAPDRRLWAARPYRSCCGPVPSGLVVLAAAGAAADLCVVRSWLGRAPETPPDADRLLVENSCTATAPHAGPPAEVARLLAAQARRLWNSVAQELEPVSVEGKARWLLSADRDALAHPCGPQERLLLLGPHDLTSTPGTGTCCCPTKRFRSWCGAPSAIPALSCWMAASPACGRPGPSGTGWSFRHSLAGVFGTAAKHAGNTRAGIRRVPRAFS